MGVGLLCCLVILMPLLLVIGAGILRGAVSLSNRCLGATQTADLEVDADELDEWIGYRQIKRPIVPAEGIAAPGMGKGMACLVLLAVVDFLVSVVMHILCHLGTASDVNGSPSTFLIIVVELISTLLAFPMCAWIMASMLGTRFGRGCLVLLIFYMIIFLILGGMFVFFRILLIPRW